MATTGEEHAAGGLQIHPMDQFVVKPLFGDGPIEWYTPTNVTLWMAIAVLALWRIFSEEPSARAHRKLSQPPDFVER